MPAGLRGTGESRLPRQDRRRGFTPRPFPPSPPPFPLPRAPASAGRQRKPSPAEHPHPTLSHRERATFVMLNSFQHPCRKRRDGGNLDPEQFRVTLVLPPLPPGEPPDFPTPPPSAIV